MYKKTKKKAIHTIGRNCMDCRALRVMSRLCIEDDKIKLIDDKTARLFQYAKEPEELNDSLDIT